jgi:hypothetical protein
MTSTSSTISAQTTPALPMISARMAACTAAYNGRATAGRPSLTGATASSHPRSMLPSPIEPSTCPAASASSH